MFLYIAIETIYKSCFSGNINYSSVFSRFHTKLVHVCLLFFYFKAVFSLLPLCRYTLLKTNLQLSAPKITLDEPTAHLQTQLKGR